MISELKLYYRDSVPSICRNFIPNSTIHLDIKTRYNTSSLYPLDPSWFVIYLLYVSADIVDLIRSFSTFVCSKMSDGLVCYALTGNSSLICFCQGLRCKGKLGYPVDYSSKLSRDLLSTSHQKRVPNNYSNLSNVSTNLSNYAI